jgi:two-component system response regulator AlgR
MPLPLRVLLVDDEALARMRLRTLLGDCSAPPAVVAGEAADAQQALTALRHSQFDLVLLDIHMPGMDGVTLARTLRELGSSNQSPQPAVVFVTAHAEHAVHAFELEAADYLTKPVRLERLQQALAKVQQRRQLVVNAQELLQKQEQLRQSKPGLQAPLTEKVLIIQDRGRAERVPLSDVLYLKAELKYVTVRTARRSYVLDGSLSELEALHAESFMRIHRNALIARRAVRALVRHHDPEEGEGWAVQLNGLDELLMVSRRQVTAVRDAIADRSA